MPFYNIQLAKNADVNPQYLSYVASGRVKWYNHIKGEV